MTTAISGFPTYRFKMREKKDIRLFFALWPDDALRRNLAEAANTILVKGESRQVPQSNLHMTLHFIGNVYFDEMACMRDRARRVEAAAFELQLDCQGQFTRPRVGWLGCRRTPDALVELHRQLGDSLKECGYRPEARPYHPHVTVARKIDTVSVNENFKSISWPVRSFALIEVQPAENGVLYRAIETFPLT